LRSGNAGFTLFCEHLLALCRAGVCGKVLGFLGMRFGPDLSPPSGQITVSCDLYHVEIDWHKAQYPQCEEAKWHVGLFPLLSSDVRLVAFV
jgi:hypothetical protein